MFSQWKKTDICNKYYFMGYIDEIPLAFYAFMNRFDKPNQKLQKHESAADRS